MTFKISEAERLRVQASIRGPLKEAEKARHDALKDPMAWMEQLGKTVWLLVHIGVMAFGLAWCVGLWMGSRHLMAPVGCVAACAALLVFPWPNVFRDRYNAVLDTAMEQMQGAMK